MSEVVVDFMSTLGLRLPLKELLSQRQSQSQETTSITASRLLSCHIETLTGCSRTMER